MINLTIGSNVTSIGYEAFYNCASLIGLTVPDSVADIGDNAFCGCSALTNVIIPNSVTSIGSGAFSNCTSLTTISIPNNITSIESSTFSACSSLTNITIPNSVTSIGNSAFYGCTSLENITMWSSVTTIGNYAFYECNSLSNVYMNSPTSWYSIDYGNSTSNPMYYANNFYMNNIIMTSIDIPDGTTEIKDYAFYGYELLENITIPESIKSIGAAAFYGCKSLKSITIPDSVTSIGSGAFYKCNSLKDVYINSLKSWCNIDFENKSGNGEQFSSSPMCYANRFYIDNVLATAIVIPDSVTQIKDYAFYGFGLLTSVIIGNNVTTIGDYAFYKCSSLTSIIIGNNVTTIGDYAFRSFSSLTNLTIPSSVTNISSRAFAHCEPVNIIVESDNQYYSSVDGVLFNKDQTELIVCAKDKTCTEYSIPDGVTSIADYAFSGFSSLIKVAIPDSVNSIGYSAFNPSISHLTDVYYAGSEDDWSEISVDRYNTRLLNATIHYNSTGIVTIWSITGYSNGVVTLTVPSDAEGNYYVIIAQYDDETGILTDCEIDVLTAENEKTLYQITTEKALSAGKIKIMLWNENLIPITEAYEY